MTRVLFNVLLNELDYFSDHLGDTILNLVKLAIVHVGRRGDDFVLLVDAHLVDIGFHMLCAPFDNFVNGAAVRPQVT